MPYEKPKFGLSIPVSYNNVVKLNVGTAVRWGPIILGSGNLISGLFSDDAQFINIFFGGRVLIRKKNAKVILE